MEYFREVSEVPHRLGKRSLCKEILEAFIGSNVSKAVILPEQMQGSAESMYQRLYKLVKFYKYQVGITRRGKEVFMEKV
jgi:hypothetical protein